jgi:hypothetical protein
MEALAANEAVQFITTVVTLDDAVPEALAVVHAAPLG